MKPLQGDVWKRRGLNLLWSASALAEVANSGEVVSIRQFFEMIGKWPADLPSNDGNTLVVAGLDGCIDLLSPADAETWLENDLRPALVNFQEEYGLDAALAFWLPSGRQRIRMNRATDAYSWVCAAPHSNHQLPIGRILWGGAEPDARRILDPRNSNQDPDGPAWIGLHHPRLS